MPTKLTAPATETSLATRVLAIDPTSRGFGYMVQEGPEQLIDWGLKEARENKNARCLRQVRKLVEHYAPSVILLEDFREPASRRSPRVRALLERLSAGPWRGALVIRIARRLVKLTFSESAQATRSEVAHAIARRFPELARRLPPPRRPWMTPDPRMAIFNAAALCLTYYQHVPSER